MLLLEKLYNTKQQIHFYSVVHLFNKDVFLASHLFLNDPIILFFFKRFYFFIFREKGREGEWEKHQCVVASWAPPTGGDLACNPGMCPDWESNWRPFSSQASTQSTEPHQPGDNNVVPLKKIFFKTWLLLTIWKLYLHILGWSKSSFSFFLDNGSVSA